MRHRRNVEGSQGWLGWAAALVLAGLLSPAAFAQDPGDDGLERTGPPALEEFETDTDGDGTPDQWYNLRDAQMVKGGVVGSKGLCLRFENDRPGRPARASRAFGVDGRKTEALIIGLWVRQENIGYGERDGDEPGLVIDFLGKELRAERRGRLGPWTKSVGPKWVHVSKRLSVPPGCRDAILSVGLIGATGVLEVDGMTIEEVPVGGSKSTNLVLNGDFQLGDPDPASWVVNGGAVRTNLRGDSNTVVEFPKSGAKLLTGIAADVARLGTIEIRARVKGQNLRGATPAGATVFFVDNAGRPLPGSAGSALAATWSGTFDWTNERAVVRIPRAAVRAVIQFEKMDRFGTLWVDDVEVVASPDPSIAEWTPYHVEGKTAGWAKVEPSTGIEANSGLDVSGMLDAPAGKNGFVTVKDGHFAFEMGGRAKFFGVSLLYPSSYIEADRADEFADRMARSGVNLVRLGDLDIPTGPGRSLFDDTRDDTKALDPTSVEKLDRLIAALKKRGVYVAIELQSGRRLRDGDGVDGSRYLPAGGGPAAAFDPKLRDLEIAAAKALLSHVNPETGLAWKEEPAIAWITLAGELTLFDLLDDTGRTVNEAAAIKTLMKNANLGSGRKPWANAEGAQWKAIADALRKDGVKVPIAGSAHFRREAEYGQMLAGPGLDFVDDRIYWNPPSFMNPVHRSTLWSLDGGLLGQANRKRASGKPYVLGQWCNVTYGTWASPFDGADLILGAVTASQQDWDAIVRRGVFFHPHPWGSAAAGTGGGEDLFPITSVLNGSPHVAAFLPHAASIMLRGPGQPPASVPGARSDRVARARVDGWDAAKGRVVVDTPFTQGLAGWSAGEPAEFATLSVQTPDRFGVVLASSLTNEPIEKSKRLLVTGVGRVLPSSFKWTDDWLRETADPGLPPLLQEPFKFKITWRRPGTVRAYALDANGKRAREVKLASADGGFVLDGDGSAGNMNWELVAE